MMHLTQWYWAFKDWCIDVRTDVCIDAYIDICHRRVYGNIHGHARRRVHRGAMPAARGHRLGLGFRAEATGLHVWVVVSYRR